MIRLALGFPGERFILLPLNILESMKDNELTGDLFIYSFFRVLFSSTISLYLASKRLWRVFIDLLQRGLWKSENK
jgi:hypothetical protein